MASRRPDGLIDQSHCSGFGRERACSHSPRNLPAQVIQILKTRCSSLRIHGIREVWYALLDAQPALRAAQVRSHPARRHEKQSSWVAGVAGSEAAHEHVERCLACTVDIMDSVLIVRDAALFGGHDPDRASRQHEVLQALDDAQGT